MEGVKPVNPHSLISLFVQDFSNIICSNKMQQTITIVFRRNRGGFCAMSEFVNSIYLSLVVELKVANLCSDK